jgi:hypothetical protein
MLLSARSDRAYDDVSDGLVERFFAGECGGWKP